MRKKIVAGNWKMNLDLEQAASWLADVSEVVEHFNSDVVVFPSAILIGDLMDLYEGNKLIFGAQNCSDQPQGAYTGEVSAAQLASVGVEYVLIGHSERRSYFAETNTMLRHKVEQALACDLIPVFCCGEPLDIRNQGTQNEYVKTQLSESLFLLDGKAISNIIIAYEPVWAIGTGVNATAAQAQQMHAFIRQTVAEKYGKNIADQLPILYGGSCKPENAAELFACPDVDGGLIGGASLKPNDFLEIIQAAG